MSLAEFYALAFQIIAVAGLIVLPLVFIPIVQEGRRLMKDVEQQTTRVEMPPHLQKYLRPHDEKH